MNGKSTLRTFLVMALAFTIATPVFASCRSGDAAARGSQVGFERAQTNAQSLSTNETQAQSALQKCLSSITQRSAANMFPSLADIYGQMVQKLCYAATSEINSTTSQISSTLTSPVSAALSNANQTVGQSTGGLISNPVSLSGTPSSSTGAGSSSDFWSSNWK